MNLSNNELDQLFESVRKEKPVASFEETQRAFVAATIASAGGVLATKSLLKLFTFKQWIIMISVLSAATVGTLLITMPSTPDRHIEKVLNGENPAKEIPSDSPSENKLNAKEVSLQTSEELISSNVLSEKSRVKTILQTRKIVTQLGKPPALVKAYVTDDGNYHFEYIITPETSEAQLKELQQKAKEAGFELKYEPTFKEGKLVRLTLHIVQQQKNGQQQDIRISAIDLEKNHEYKVAWNVDEEGDATTIACGESFKSQEIQELMEAMEMEEMLADFEGMHDEFAAMAREIEKEYAELGIKDSLNSAEWEEELRAAQRLLEESKQVGSLAATLENLDEEILEDLRNELERAREQLHEQNKELEKSCAEMRASFDKHNAAMHKSCEEHKRKCKEASKAMRSELVKDDLIDPSEKKVKMKGGKGKLKVNGKDIPKNLHKKYRELVKKHFEIDTDKRGVQWTWEHTED
ncbi:MAG: hypothetical protein ACFHU9_17290 [Fluviicola sp.]